ncbi:Astacin-like metalloendopeptidase [Leptotrombidium deliense]|uniref:Metalloendopeptidase n=1 Tax=Leptotrombidium deliense TaxID=299467 RepID=A0A443S3N1_9ACAR|nr:Astacin-like metalloendopeptidase [Leptotrombidium deliense]
MLKCLLFVCFIAISTQLTNGLTWITNASDAARANGKCPVDGEIYRDCSKQYTREVPVPWPPEFRFPLYIYVASVHNTQEQVDLIREVICYMQYLLIDIREVSNTKYRPLIKVLFDNKFCGIEDKAGWKGKDAAHTIYVTDACSNTPAIAHMIMHVLGFPHEINHHKRDQYVHIIKGNLADEDKVHFEKYDSNKPPGHHFNFDPQSVMHYHFDDFRDNDILPVIVPLQRGMSPFDFGRAIWLKREAAKSIFSYKDVAKMKEFYATFEVGSKIDQKNLVNDSIAKGRQSGWFGDPHDDPNREGLEVIQEIYTGCRENLKGKNIETDA